MVTLLLSLIPLLFPKDTLAIKDICCFQFIVNPVVVGLFDSPILVWGGGKKPPTELLTGNIQSDQIWCANSLRHELSVNIKINLRMAVIFAHVSMFLCVVKKSGRIGQNQENHDKVTFGAHVASKHDNCDRMHQITLHYGRNVQYIQLMLFFSR